MPQVFIDCIYYYNTNFFNLAHLFNYLFIKSLEVKCLVNQYAHSLIVAIATNKHTFINLFQALMCRWQLSWVDYLIGR